MELFSSFSLFFAISLFLLYQKKRARIMHVIDISNRHGKYTRPRGDQLGPALTLTEKKRVDWNRVLIFLD